MYSTVIATLRPSLIHVMAERTGQAIASGKSVVDMTLGEPDFPTPLHVCEAAVTAIMDGQTRYTPINGTAQLREVIVAKFKLAGRCGCRPE
jgi:aspartate aminotransferase